jgi:2-oxoglutarate dehydrogenase E1 component
MPQDFTEGTFRPVLADRASFDNAGVTRVLLASGKVVYDLEAAREKAGDTATAIVRVEQLAPLPAKEIAAELAKYPGADVVWVQDEPANQGAWPFVAMNLPQALAELGETRLLRIVSRKASASPATGSSKRHAEQQAELVAAAFAR